MRFTYLPVLRGLLALKRGEPSEGIRQLQVAAPDELATRSITLFAFFGGLYPAYVRGEAYLALNEAAAAAAEFQKILDHRGIVLADPAGAMARLELGRAFALAGKQTKSENGIRRFPYSLERCRPRPSDP